MKIITITRDDIIGYYNPDYQKVKLLSNLKELDDAGVISKKSYDEVSNNIGKPKDLFDLHHVSIRFTWDLAIWQGINFECDDNDTKKDVITRNIDELKQYFHIDLGKSY